MALHQRGIIAKRLGEHHRPLEQDVDLATKIRRPRDPGLLAQADELALHLSRGPLAPGRSNRKVVVCRLVSLKCDVAFITWEAGPSIAVILLVPFELPVDLAANS